MLFAVDAATLSLCKRLNIIMLTQKDKTDFLGGLKIPVRVRVPVCLIYNPIHPIATH